MNTDKPVFVQIVEMIENDIINGVYGVDEMIISTTQISKLLSVNPTTAVKAVGMLADRGIIYKKRGLGMAVTATAREIILTERRQEFYQKAIPQIIQAAQLLGISKAELARIIEEDDHD